MFKSFTIDVTDTIKTLNSIQGNLSKPMKFLDTVSRYVLAQVKSMFKGRRPDVREKRGVKWPKLASQTIARKRNMLKKGELTGTGNPNRPMIMEGELRDSIEIVDKTVKGFSITTKRVSEKGFPYPGYHNIKQPGHRKSGRFPWLFIEEKKEVAQIQKILIDFLKGELKTLRAYRK